MKIAYLLCLIILILYFSISSLGAESSGDGDNSKIVIIRADDIYNINSELKWLSDLALDEDFRVTYAVIPGRLGPKDIAYLGNLDKDHFELAAHGYNHEHLKDLSYEEQYAIINRSTKTMEGYFHIRPYTFIPPFESVDDNTVKACYELGYHSILMPYDTQSAQEMNVLRKFSWEPQWYPLKHNSFKAFKLAFDSYYNSSADAFYIVLHPNTFGVDNKKLDRNLIDDFNKSIYYMKSKKVKFETVEMMYREMIHHKEFQRFVYEKNKFFKI